MSQSVGEDRWRVEVDRGTCIGSGLCAGMAPEHFELDDEGTSRPLAEETAPDESIVDAAESCPVEAIRVRRAADGGLIAPTV